MASLIMIDENLIRHELSSAERAQHVAKRKVLYEALHPETANGSNQHSSLRQNGEPSAPRFTKATADLTGQSERDVQREAARGEALADVIPRIKGTSLDKPGCSIAREDHNTLVVAAPIASAHLMGSRCGALASRHVAVHIWPVSEPSCCLTLGHEAAKTLARCVWSRPAPHV